MRSTIAAILCAAVVCSGTAATQKMDFLQEARQQARDEMHTVQQVRAEEQAELAIQFNLACMKEEEAAKKLREKEKVIALQKEAVEKQGASYQHHVEDVEACALLAFNSIDSESTSETYQGSIQLSQEVNKEYNLGYNDGFARPYVNIFTKTVIPASWDADYYDVAIPYNLTCADVGGIAIDVESVKSVYNYTASEYNDSFVGSRIQQEFREPPELVANKKQKIVQDFSGVNTYDWHGKHLYAIALPSQLFPEALAQQGFYSFANFRKIGILADLILTDGTIVNCVIIDGIGSGHSNGVCNGWTASSTNAAQDGVRYNLNELRLPQYAKFFHAASCHTVELSGDISKFKEFYGFNDDVRISYIRIYKYSFLEEE